MQKNLYRFSRRTTNSKMAQFIESPASDQVTTLLDRCEEYKTYTGDFTYRMRKECRSTTSFIEDAARVTDCLDSFHHKCQQSNADPVLVECFEKTKVFQLNFFDLYSRLNTTLDNKLATRLSECTRDEFNEVKTAKKNFQKAKAAYEAALTSKSKKGKDNESEIQSAKANYFKAGNETLITLQHSVKEIELHLLQAFCDYWDAYYDFQSKSAKWVSNIRPLVDRYRTHWKEATEQLKKEKENRGSGSNSFEDAAGSKIFGVPLKELMLRTSGEVPTFIEDVVAHLMKIAPTLEGVFRISAMKSELTEIQKKIDGGERIHFSDLVDPHIIPALFKQFFRELPEPLLTFELYTPFLKANLIEDEDDRIKELKTLIDKIPDINRSVLKRLLALLSTIADHEDVNKMGPTNLSTVIGPNILYGKEINPLTMVEDMENANAIIVTLITKYQEIFKIEDPLQAAKENDFNALVRLQKEGKDLTGKDKTGKTILHYSSIHASVDMTEFILKYCSNSEYVNAFDNAKKTAIMYACQGSDSASICAQYILNEGADIDLKDPNGKTVLELAEEASGELASVLIETKNSLKLEKEKEKQTKQPEPKTPEPIQEPKETTKPVVEDEPTVTETPKEPEKPKEPEAPKEPETPKEPEKPKEIEKPKEPEKKPEPKRVVETQEQIVARAKLKAASLLKNSISERTTHDDEVEDVIFERVRSLQSLLTQDVPLQSVYSLINMEEMTSTAFALVKATIPKKFSSTEITALNGTLKLSADTLKNLFAAVKKFASLFVDDEKKEVLSNALSLQTTIKSLFGVVKQLNAKPNDEALKENLHSSTKQFVDGVYKFFKSCDNASTDYISTTCESCASNLTKIIECGSGASKDDLDDACVGAAFSCLKLSQLIKVKGCTQSQDTIKNSLHNSASIIERSTLELINECKKLWAQGLKPDDDTNMLVKKVLLEFRQITNTLDKGTPITNFSLEDQAGQFNNITNTVSDIVQQLMDIEFSTDLDKALVLQMKMISRKLESLANIDTLEEKTLMSVTQEIVDVFKKIRVGISAMEKKSRDKSLNRRMKVWTETLLNYMLVTRLSVSSLILKLPIEGEMQLSVKIEGAINLCSDFYKFLIELRS